MAARINPSTGPKPDRRIRDALKLELEQYAPAELDSKGNRKPGPRKETKLRRIVRKLVDAACHGDMDAIKEINNRIDGKAVQPMANDPDNPLLPTDPSGAFQVTFVVPQTKK